MNICAKESMLLDREHRHGHPTKVRRATRACLNFASLTSTFIDAELTKKIDADKHKINAFVFTSRNPDQQPF
jgi:hypothetical protein